MKLIEVVGGITSSTKQFVWAANKLSEERDALGSLNKRFFARGQDNSGTKYFYCKDSLGSVKEVADNSGNDVQISTFDSFGRRSAILETVSCDFTYAGYYSHNRSGLLFTLYRQYNPTFGRWLSRDPVGQGHLYAYAGNNPLSFTDPLGLFIEYGPSLGEPGPNEWCPKKAARIRKISMLLESYMYQAITRVRREQREAVAAGDPMSEQYMGMLIDKYAKELVGKDSYSTRLLNIGPSNRNPDFAGNDRVWWDITTRASWKSWSHQDKYDNTGYGIGITYDFEPFY